MATEFKRPYTILGHEVERYAYRLLIVTAKLHESLMGSYDLLLEDENLYYEFIRARIFDWDKSLDGQERYDEAVRQMCLETIKLFQARRLYLGGPDAAGA